jgi:hypothetical protein
MESVSSPRLNESLQTVTRNLDVVEAELRAAESAAPETATSPAIARNEQIHSLARELRAKVARIQRGEAALVVNQQK